MEFWLESGYRRAIVVVLIFTLIALVSSAQIYINWRQAGADVPFLDIARLKLAEWLLWAAVLPTVYALDRRLGFSAGRPLVGTLVHLTWATLWFAVLNGIMTGLAPLVDSMAGPGDFWSLYWVRAAQRWPGHLVVYALILAVPWAIRSASQRERLERELVESELQLIRLQLQPHFLFNSLHAVGSLVRAGDRTAAITVLSELADLLRRALSHVEEEKVTVGEEMEFLARYARIQRVRFEGRLEIEMNVGDGCQDALLPSMIIQPLVENAIRHGVEPDSSAGRIEVRVVRNGALLHVAIADDGRGFPRTERDGRGRGLGLTSTRRRLRMLYGDRQSMEIVSDGNGSTVTLTVPFET